MRCLAPAVLAALAPAASAQPADDRAALLEALRAANAAFDAGRFADALAAYDAIAARWPLPEVHFRRGACLERLGRPLDAAAAYRRYLELAPDAGDAGRVRADVDRLEAAGRARPARLVVVSRPAGAEVLLGERALGRSPVDVELPPGEVIVTLRADGREPVSREVLLVAGERKSLDVDLPPLAPPPADHGTLGWTLAGVGAASLVASGVLYALTASAIEDANAYDRRDPDHSRAALDRMQDDAGRLEAGFWVTGGIGLAALGAASWFLLTADDAPAPAASGLRFRF